MGGSSSVGFFDSLSIVGWMGILLWIIFGVVVVMKSEFFTSYEYRFPRIDIWDEYLYEDWHYIVFMVVRFLVILIIIYVVTKIMFIL